MELQRQISRKLYQEHITVLDLLGRFEQALLRLRGEPPAAGDPVWGTLLPQLAGALQHEITRHFDLEEKELFPRLHARGEGDLADLLLEDHVTIRKVASALLALIQRARVPGLDAAGWRELKVAGLELVERLGSHAEKEQGALVPLVDEMLDAETDEQLTMEYAG